MTHREGGRGDMWVLGTSILLAGKKFLDYRRGRIYGSTMRPSTR